MHAVEYAPGIWQPHALVCLLAAALCSISKQQADQAQGGWCSGVPIMMSDAISPLTATRNCAPQEACPGC